MSFLKTLTLISFFLFTLQDSFLDPKQYPTRKSIKGLQPDFQDTNQVIGNEVHGVAFNFVWETWQPTLTSNCASGQVKYQGYCFTPQQSHINQIRTYTNAKVVVTGVLYGVPSWARRSCSGAVVAQIFCAPTDEGSKYYGLFTGFIAWYFNGQNGNGRVADFVIHNEVNAVEWFNYGCSAGNCNIDTWTSIYADSWNSAYDHIKNEQSAAKVLISFEHDFFNDLDYHKNDYHVVYSVETFLKYLIPKLGNREWRLAYHSYPVNLLKPEISANDYPYITFGNIGVLSGWLHANYPNNPHAWEIQLTENGINGVNSEMYQKQKDTLCDAFRNVLGTPGVESFIYHRLVDNIDETKNGLGLGLWDANKNMKPAWTTYALANRKDVASGYPSCGFEYLPYVKMSRAYNGNYHYVSSRTLPSGYKEEIGYKILRNKKDETTLVFECREGGANGPRTFISKDHQCEGQFNMGPMGYIYNKNVDGSVPVYRCYIKSNGDHFISSSSDCEGNVNEGLMGYAFQA